MRRARPATFRSTAMRGAAFATVLSLALPLATRAQSETPGPATSASSGTADSEACRRLGKALLTHIEAGRYVKPDGGNALLDLDGLDREDCHPRLHAVDTRVVMTGIEETMAYLGEHGRAIEMCPTLRVLKRRMDPAAPDSGGPWFQLVIHMCDSAGVASLPVESWSDADTAEIRRRVLARRASDDAGMTALLKREAIRARIQVAMEAQRIYSPPGDNAAELLVLARATDPDGEDQLLSSMVDDIAPYVILATEIAVQHRDRREYMRLLSLLERLAPDVPALPRLRTLGEGW